MQTSKIQTALRASISTTLLLAASGAFAQGVSITAPGVNVQEAQAAHQSPPKAQP